MLECEKIVKALRRYFVEKILSNEPAVANPGRSAQGRLCIRFVFPADTGIRSDLQSFFRVVNEYACFFLYICTYSLVYSCLTEPGEGKRRIKVTRRAFLTVGRIGRIGYPARLPARRMKNNE